MKITRETTNFYEDKLCPMSSNFIQCVSMFKQVTMVIVSAILILATAVPDIQVVMSFRGSLGGTFIAFMSLGRFSCCLRS